MKKTRTTKLRLSRPLKSARSQMGFSLMELVIAMAVFTIVAGAAFSIFSQHATASNEQQTLSGVNIGLRNAMAQMQMDFSGAGGNLVAGVPNPPQFYFSVIINNNVPTLDGGTATNCTPNSSWGYPVNTACFDSITALSPNDSLVKSCSTGYGGGTHAPVLDIITTGPNLAAATTVTGDDPNNPGVTATQTADATCYQKGDELLFIMAGNSSASTCDVNSDTFVFCMNAVTLTANATVSGGAIQLPTSASGSTTSDPLGIIYRPGGITYFPNTLHNNFPVGAYIVDLGTGANAITYSVMTNPSNANDTQLVRCPGMSCTSSNAQVVADQIIGFKVGASIWNWASSNATEIGNYIYNAASYCSDQVTGTNCMATPMPASDPYDFTLVRALRISVIARTPPRVDARLSLLQNGFDGGPYLVQPAATVVDLRNLSNVDTSN